MSSGEGPGQEQEALEKLLKEGIDLIASKQPDAALGCFDRIISDYEHRYGQLHDKSYLSFLSLAEFVAFVKEHHPDKDVVWLSPCYAQAHYYKGYLLVQMKRPTEAVCQLRRAIALNPMHGPYYLELAYIHAAAREFNEALNLYNQAVTKDFSQRKTATAAAYRGIGYIYIESGMLSEAAGMYRRSLEIDPESAIARNELEYIATLQRLGGRQVSPV